MARPASRRPAGRHVPIDGKTPMGPNLPTSAENLTNALLSDLEFWATATPN
jgi:hypothetical protein